MKKTLWTVLIILVVVIGGIALYNLLKKKVKEEAAEGVKEKGKDIISGIEKALGIGIGAKAAGGVVTAIPIGKAGAVAALPAAAGAGVAGGYGTIVGTSTAAIVGIVTFMAVWTYLAVKRIFGKTGFDYRGVHYETADEWAKAMEASGVVLTKTVSKVSLKAPDKRR